MTFLSDRSEQEPEDRDRRVGRAFRWSLLVLANLAAVCWLSFLLVSKVPPERAPTRTRPAQSTRGELLASGEFPLMPFTDVTSESGLQFEHFSEQTPEYLLPDMMGSGCAFLDFDNDGDQDALLVNSWYLPGHDHETVADREGAATPGPGLALFRNDGRGRFENVTPGSGLERNVYGMGVAAGDYDADGLTDVFLAALGKNVLYRNLGEGKFSDVTGQAGVAGDERKWSTSCGFFDYDQDGWLDLFVCNYVAWTEEYDRSIDHQTLGVTSSVSPSDFPSDHCLLYRNQGNGAFEDVSQRAGIRVRDPMRGVPLARALAVRFCDLDHDGWQDILVANDLCPSFLFRNKGNGAFEEIAMKAGLGFDATGMPVASMGLDTADLHSEGDVAIAVANFGSRHTVIFREQERPLQYQDESRSMGVASATTPYTSWGLFFFDADLDGRPDMFQCNGVVGSPKFARLRGWDHLQPSQLFWNCGRRSNAELALTPPERCGEALSNPLMGRGAAYADIDADGDLDILVSQNNGPAVLLRNDQQLGHHWLRVRLRDKGPNWQAIGAQVELTAGGMTQRQQVAPTRSYMSQVELPVTFGLGKQTKVDTLRIIWPDGAEQVVSPANIDRDLEVHRSVERSGA
jgi:hypothetical protein